MEHDRDSINISKLGLKNTSALFNSQALYFFYYMAAGSYIPFIYLYFERLGLSGVQIGTLAALPVLISASTSLFWSGTADALHWHQKILRISLFLSPIAVFLLSRVTTMALLILMIVVFALFSSPIVPLLDSLALKTAVKNDRSYGDLRLWGSIGWAISTVLIGWLIERLGIHWLFYGYIVFMTFGLITSFFQPHQHSVPKSSIWSGIKDLLSNKTYILFLLSVFLLVVSSNGVLTFLSIFMDSIGTKEGLIGLGWALSAVSEVPVMMLSGRVIRKIGSKGLLMIAFIMYAIRWMLLSFIHTPFWALTIQLLHGPSFASFLVGSVTFIQERTPAGLNTTALTIFNPVIFGLGSIVGSLLGGYLLDQVGMSVLFQVFSAIAFGSLLFFMAGQRYSTQPASSA
ncbi:MAG: MFS transporter [Anaerolineaceae bacterium]